MRLVIHFGMHKTGSSSIQQSLFQARGNEHFHYVRLGTPNHSAPLTTAFLADPSAHHASRKRGLDRESLRSARLRARKALARELKAASAPLVVLSAEGFGRLRLEEMQDFHHFVSRFAEDVSAVGYVRPLQGFLESSFQEQVKGTDGRPEFQLQFDGYRTRFEKIEQVFGREHVRFWRFDPAAFPHGCVVRDFCARIGIALPERVVRVNEGLSRDAVGLLYAYKKFGPAYGHGGRAIRANARLVKKVAELRGAKLRLSSQMVQPLMERQREQIAWMEARVGGSLGGGIVAGEEAIETESDLFRFRPATLRWLAQEAGLEFDPEHSRRMTTQQVADWMDVLRAKLRPVEAGQDENGDAAGSAGGAELAGAAGSAGAAESAGDAEDAPPLDLDDIVRAAVQADPDSAEAGPAGLAAELVQAVLTQVLGEIERCEAGMVMVPGLGQFRVRWIARNDAGRKVAVRQVLFSAADNAAP